MNYEEDRKRRKDTQKKEKTILISQTFVGMAPSATLDRERSAIYAKGGVWSSLVDRVKQDNRQSSEASKPDGYLFIVGPRGCGKTTLLQSFLHGEKGAGHNTKPTEGLDYTFARKSSSLANVERKDVSSASLSSLSSLYSSKPTPTGISSNLKFLRSKISILDTKSD